MAGRGIHQLCCKFMVGMGLAFQMPVILLFLVRVGILDYKKLSEFRMYAVVVNLILAAVITPTGDPFTSARGRAATVAL